MNILLTCVNYNSYNELLHFLDSIEIAFNRSEDINLTVCVADNSSNKQKMDLCGYNFECHCYSFQNLGYLGGATRVFESLPNMHIFDYVIISNVDLVVDELFFKNFPHCEDQSLGWISPSIISLHEDRDKGVGLATRPSALKLKLLMLMFRFPWLEYLVENSLYKRKKFTHKNSEIEKNIYSGHGSFIILTKYFFKVYPHMHYPMFLWGEELFLGELMRIQGLRVVYNPLLKVYDSEHISTSKMTSSFSCRCQHDSLKYIYNRFYKI